MSSAAESAASARPEYDGAPRARPEIETRSPLNFSKNERTWYACGRPPAGRRVRVEVGPDREKLPGPPSSLAFLDLRSAAAEDLPDAWSGFSAAVAGVGVDRGRGLDQALAFEEGGEAGVAGVVEAAGAARSAPTCRRKRAGSARRPSRATLDEQREALLRMVHEILDAPLHRVEEAAEAGIVERGVVGQEDQLV